MNKKHSTYFTESLVRKSTSEKTPPRENLPNQLTDLLSDIYARPKYAPR